jgi:IS5 family transposase
MNTHIDAHSKSKLIHSIVAMASNVADRTMLPELSYRGETRVWGEQAYRGQREAPR